MDESNKPLKWKVTNVTQTSGVIDDNSRLFMNALQNLQGNGGEESVSVMCYENTSIGDKTWKVTFTQELTNNTRIVEIKQTACEDVETYAISGCRIYRMSPTVVPASGTSNLRVYYSASTTTTHSCGGSVETGTTSGSTTYSAISANDSTEQRTIPISVSVRWKGKTCTASSSITQSGKACSKTGYTIDCDNVSTSLTSTIEATSTSATISYTAPLMWHDDCGNSGPETTHSGTKRITFSQNTGQNDREIRTSITVQYVSESISSNTCTKNITLIQPGTGACVDYVTYEIRGCEITNAPTYIPSSGGNINVSWSMTGITHHTCFENETEIKTGVSVNIVPANDSFDQKQITLTAQTDSFHGETCTASKIVPQDGKTCTIPSLTFKLGNGILFYPNRDENTCETMDGIRSQIFIDGNDTIDGINLAEELYRNTQKTVTITDYPINSILTVAVSTNPYVNCGETSNIHDTKKISGFTCDQSYTIILKKASGQEMGIDFIPTGPEIVDENSNP